MQRQLFSSNEPTSINSQIAAHVAPPRPKPFQASTGLAKAILQKAIRRGEREHALRAATVLLDHDQLWRRLAVIAIEDVGFGNWQVFEAITRLAHSKRERQKRGDEWHVASFAVSALCDAIKCRATDDLQMVSQNHPAFSSPRSQTKKMSDNQRLDFVAGRASVIERAVVALSFLQADSTQRHWSISSERADMLFRAFFDSGVPAEIVDVCERSFRATRETLPFLACILSTELPKEVIASNDTLTETAMIHSVPNWAYDMFCREGRKALEHFLNFDCASARTIRTTVPAAKRVGVLGLLVFAVEGERCRKRRYWSLANDLRRMTQLECHSPYFHDSSRIIAQLSDDLPLLNLARFEAQHG